MAFGAITFGAQKYSSKLVLISSELLRDSAFNLAAEIGRVAGERIGRIVNTDLTTGSGAGTVPKGIITAATSGVTAATATAIAWTEVLDLIHSVDVAYRSQPGAGIMCHDNVVLYLRKLADGMGRLMWESNPVVGQPDRLHGYPVIVNNDMASAVSGTNKTLLFGALNKYKVREVASIRLRRLVERYAEYDQEGFVAFMEYDGDLLDAGTNPVKYLKQG